MDGQIISDNKVLNRAPSFLNVFGSNRDSRCDRFPEALSTHGVSKDTISVSTIIAFTGVSITAANDKSDLRAIPPPKPVHFQASVLVGFVEGSRRIH